MDKRLSDRLKNWHEHLKVVHDAERVFFSLEASDKAMYGALFLKSKGGNIPTREAETHSHPEYKIFKEGLAQSRARYLNERRLLDLKIKAYEATYLEFKNEQEAIRKHP